MFLFFSIQFNKFLGLWVGGGGIIMTKYWFWGLKFLYFLFGDLNVSQYNINLNTNIDIVTFILSCIYFFLLNVYIVLRDDFFLFKT